MSTSGRMTIGRLLSGRLTRLDPISAPKRRAATGWRNRRWHRPAGLLLLQRLPPRAAMSDEIDYKLIGDDLQAVIITLDPNEMVIAEAGAMMYMQDGIVMNTTLDPNAQGGGLMGRLFQGAKRALSGDTFFVTTFANSANKRQDVAFSSHFPGKIRPIDLRDWGGTIIAQKDSFLV